MSVTCGAKAAGCRPRPARRVIQLRAAQVRTIGSPRHQHLAAGQQRRRVKGACGAKAAGRRPRASRRIIQLRAAQGGGAIVSASHQHLAIGQQRRRVSGACGDKVASGNPARIDQHRITQPFGHHQPQPVWRSAFTLLKLPAHRSSALLPRRFDQPRRFDLYSLPCLVAKVHFALHQFHTRPGAQLAQLILKLPRRTVILQKQKLFTAPAAHEMHAVGLWVGVAIDHLVVVDLHGGICAAHRPHGHAHSFAFHNERVAVTLRIKADKLHAATRLLPARHRQPRLLFNRLESGRRYQVFLPRRPRLARTESVDFLAGNRLTCRRKFHARRFLRVYPVWSNGAL